MKQLQANFIISAEKLSQCPETILPEFPLLGRSNVGKSSFINALANNKKIAKTSNTPGKTRLINYFNCAEEFMIADLPGYGYAKVSKSEQDSWQKNLEQYLLKRKLVSTIQFIDARHEIQKNDILMQEWLKFNNIPCLNILTKCDYISRNEVASKLAKIEKEFQNKALAFSSKNRIYVDGVLSHLSSLIG
mgnify:CR=1 FL=1